MPFATLPRSLGRRFWFRVQPERLELAEQRARVNAQFPGSGGTVAVVAPQHGNRREG